METTGESIRSTFAHVPPGTLKPPVPCQDVLLVVPNAKTPVRDGGPPYFASVIAFSPGDIIFSKPRRALHVIDDGAKEYGYSDGVLALKAGCVYLSHGVVWPELWRALRTEPKSWSKLFRQRSGERPPYMIIKDWHEEGWAPDVSDPSESPGDALLILQNWNRWEEKNSSWMERLLAFAKLKSKIDPTLEQALNVPKLQKSKLEWFSNYCKELGLSRKSPTVFDAPFQQLLSLLDVALKLERS